MIKTIILAAGEGTRMKTTKSKVLHKLLNREILSYVIEASKIEDSETIVIGGKNKDYIEKNYKDVKVIEQKIGKDYPYGTGYAVSLALDNISDDDIVLVLNGDIPLIRKSSIKDFLDFHKIEKNSCSVLSTMVDNPKTYGRIVRDNDNLFYKIVEDKDANEDELKINEINIGIYAFTGIDLKESISLIDANNSQNELYLTDCIEILQEKSKKIGAFIGQDPTEFYGINNKKELSIAEKTLRKRINDSYMEEGVIMETPEIISIEPGVEIGKDTILSGYVKIFGKTKISDNCVIEGSCRIVDSVISENVKIDNSIVENSKVGKNTDIGPFAHLRPNAELGENVHIGNFVEVKNSVVGNKTKAGHLAYIGDSDLGEDINVGCGVIFVNYDGKFKHRSIVEDGAFIGSNSNIVAPVKVYKEGYIAAGSTITKDVDEGCLSIERAEQKNIPGYVEKKKKKDLEIQRSKNDK